MSKEALLDPKIMAITIAFDPPTGVDWNTTFIGWINLSNNGMQVAHRDFTRAELVGAMQIDTEVSRSQIESGWFLTFQWSPNGHNSLIANVTVNFLYADGNSRKYIWNSRERPVKFNEAISWYYYPAWGPGLPA